jgi:hypothetical protein
MRRILGSTMLGIGMVAMIGGCDLTAISDLGGELSDVSKAIVTDRSESADASMIQLRTRDQLKDGTGTNCTLAQQDGNGTGQGDVLRLRDGSCQQ